MKMKTSDPARPATGRAPRALPRRVVAAIDESKILGIRAGARSDHRFIGIWPVVVDGRVFARSWTQKPGGWYRTLLDDPLGTIQVGEREMRFAPCGSAASAFATPWSAPSAEIPDAGSVKYVRGFRTQRRRETTMEFLPR